MEFDQAKCWFCLASPSVEKHLVITVGESCYLTLAKGGMVPEHFLICPMEHFQNILACSEDIRQEMAQFKEAIRKFYLRRDTVPVFFERNYKTSHMQLQAVPIPQQATRELKEIFLVSFTVFAVIFRDKYIFLYLFRMSRRPKDVGWRNSSHIVVWIK